LGTSSTPKGWNQRGQESQHAKQKESLKIYGEEYSDGSNDHSNRKGKGKVQIKQEETIRSCHGPEKGREGERNYIPKPQKRPRKSIGKLSIEARCPREGADRNKKGLKPERLLPQTAARGENNNGKKKREHSQIQALRKQGEKMGGEKGSELSSPRAAWRIQIQKER